MALTFEVLSQDEIAMEYVIVNSIEEDTPSENIDHDCCKSSEEEEDDGCCTDDCDCNCCHHLTIATSQIISKIYEIQFNNSISSFLENEFLYEYLFGNDANASIFQPPQNV